MPIIVNDILKNDLFANTDVVADSSLLMKKVSAVVYIKEFTSLPNLEKDNLLILDTLCVSMNEFENFLQFILSLEISSICVLKNNKKDFPSWFFDLADENKNKIITLSCSLSGEEVASKLNLFILRENSHFWSYAEELKSKFFALNFSDTQIIDILKLLSSVVKRDISFVDVAKEIRYFSNDNNSVFVEKINKSSVKDILTEFETEVVSTDCVVVGYIVFDYGENVTAKKYLDFAVEQVKNSLLLYIQKSNSRLEVEKRYRNEFVQDLLSHNIRMEKEVWSRARIFKWDLNGPQIVVVFDIDNYKSQLTSSIEEGKGNTRLESVKLTIYSTVKHHMKSLGTSSFPSTLLSDSVVYILPAEFAQEATKPFKDLNTAISKIMTECKDKTGFSVTVGIGNVSANIFNCYDSYNQAKQGLELLRRDTGGDVVARWSDMGLYKLLCSLKNNADTQDFIKETIGSLMNENGDSTLYQTLTSLIENNWNLRKTSDSMGVHYNTMQYRYNKICETLLIDPGNSRERLKIILAVELYRMYPLLDFDFMP
ncbi:MAG: helix-turn-helix domain-containing protein [Synergistaceae bacterium]